MVGRNVRMDVRWAAADADQTRDHAAELVALAPDVILASSGSVVGPLRRLTRTIPIVFTETSDPVGAGFVDSLARPGGNVTGFLSSNTAWAGNGWSCSRRSRRPSRGWRCCASRHPLRDGPVGRDPVGGAVFRDGAARDRRARCGRDRAHRPAFARTPNSGMILTASGGSFASQSDHHVADRTSCRRSTFYAVSSQTEVSSPTGPTQSTCIGARPLTSTASLRARSRPTCRCRPRRNSSW